MIKEIRFKDLNHIKRTLKEYEFSDVVSLSGTLTRTQIHDLCEWLHQWYLDLNTWREMLRIRARCLNENVDLKRDTVSRSVRSFCIAATTREIHHTRYVTRYVQSMKDQLSYKLGRERVGDDTVLDIRIQWTENFIAIGIWKK